MIKILFLLVAYGHGYVIPRDEMESSDYSSPDGFPNQEDQLDINVMFIYLGSMLVMYLFICIIYFTTKIVVTRLLTMHSGISLLNEDGAGERLNSRTRRLVESAENRWPSNLDDEDTVRDKLSLLSPEEQFYYKQGEEFIKQNPPLIIHESGSRRETGAHASDAIINEQTRQYIEEEGALAWEFQPNPNLPNDTIIVENKTEISFLNFKYDASVSTNLPIPCINRVYYCEFKIFELSLAENQNTLNDDELISFGLSTSPYPYFRLPGRHHHSIAYDTTGSRRFNDSFKLDSELANIFPKCEKGDIIGIGYRTRSGTVFFTRNGKKLNEKPIGGHVKGWKFKYLYPIVGANVPCKIHVNFGSYGFVFIEANVKKWGYAKPNGLKMPPPSYDDYVQDTLLESGYEDNDHSDNESDEDSGSEQGTRYRRYKNTIIDDEGNLLPPPPGFEFSTSPHPAEFDEEINLDSLPAEPPSYSDDEIKAMKGSRSDQKPSVGRSRSYLLEDVEVREGKSRMLEDLEAQDEDDYEYADSDEDYEANIDELQAMIESGSIESGDEH